MRSLQDRFVEPVIHAIVAHERMMELASAVVMNLEIREITIGLEPSPKNLRGITHRKLGDHTEALAVLMETTNVSEGRQAQPEICDEATILREDACEDEKSPVLLPSPH